MSNKCGQIAGRYTLLSEIARGGMGVVYRARDEQSGRTVALKQARPNARVGIERLFQREYHTLVQLRHPRIIEVDVYGVDPAGPYYTMELLDGADLGDVSPLGFERACRHLRDVASSLALLHARRLLHRDLSPRNVRITGDGRAKLIDFGALVTFGSSPQVVGTPPVVPPEALYGMELDQRADLYGLGALAYYVLTGRHAYAATSLRMLPSLWKAGPPAAPSTLAPDIPAALDDLVLSLLSPEALGRPRSAADVADRLNAIADLPSEATIEVGSSYLTNPQLVGRREELQRIHRHVEDLLSGRGSGLLISGLEGVGRSRLLAEGVLLARLGGAVVARADAELQRGPYGAFRAVVGALMASAPELLASVAGERAAWLAHVVPELAELAGVEPVARLPRDRAEQGMRVRQAAIGLLDALAGQRPLLIAVDNAHALDESSLAVFSYVGQRARSGPVAMWFTARDGEAKAAPQRLAQLTERLPHMELKAFPLDETTALVRAMFGRVENAGRMGRWLHDLAGGNAAYCIALASRLVDSGAVRYLDGVWVLPADPPAELSDQRLDDLHEQQLAGLSSAARELVTSLSVERGRIALGRALGLARVEPQQTFAALTELIGRGVLLADDDGYRFSHSALREHLFSSLDEANRRALHLCAAELSLKDGEEDPLLQIDAGFHLVHAGEERRGAALLDRATRSLVVTVEGLRFAAPALETALHIYEREKESAWERLPLLNALTAAGWYVSYRYIEKYGEQSLQLTLELFGLARANRLAPLVGEAAAFRLGVGSAMLRHALVKKRIRSKELRDFQELARPLIGTVGITVGAAATMLDGAGARRVLDRVRLMRHFGEGHVLSVMYDYCRYYTLASEGRLGEAERVAPGVLAWFRSEEGVEVLGEEAAKALSGGLMCGMSQFLSFRDGSDAECWAQALGELGQSFYEAMAAQSRFVYHAARGESVLAKVQLDELDRYAMRVGTTWQSAMVVPLLSAASAARTQDVAELRRALDELERRAEHVPVLRAYAEVYRAQAELLAGRASEALSRIEQVRWTARPHAWFDWVSAATTYIRALTHNGRPEHARSILRECEQGFGEIERPYAFFSVELGLSAVELDLAAGQQQLARRRCELLIDTHRAQGSPLTLVRLYAARCTVAVAEGDEAAFEMALPMLEHWARHSENPALIAILSRVQSEARRRFHGSRERAPQTGSELMVSAAHSLLRAEPSREGRAEGALRLAVDAACATAGHLFLVQEGQVRHACARPPGEPVPFDLQAELGMLAETTLASEAHDRTLAAVTAIQPRGAAGSEVGGRKGWQVEWLVAPGGVGPLGAVVLRPRPDVGVVPLSGELLRVLAGALGDGPDDSEHPLPLDPPPRRREV